jgi:polysaccharide export outer membrane protein
MALPAVAYGKRKGITVRGVLTLVGSMVFLAVLSGCSVAPGMRMAKPATLPVSAGADGTKAGKQVEIQEITLPLVRSLKDQTNAIEAGAVRDLMTQPPPYVIGVGDVLDITVWGHPELLAAQGPQSQTVTRQSDPLPGFVVDQSGNVQFPYAGNVHMAGLTAEQAQAVLKRALVKTAYNNPQVTLRVASYRARQVYIDGEVHTPGELSLNDLPMSLYEAISRAGGFTSAADQSRMILTRGNEVYGLSLPLLIASGDDPKRIQLRNGDLLHVPSRDENGAYVMGEVNKPVTALPMKDGVLTLSDAISQAGSVNSSTADAAQMFVIRGSGSTSPEIFHLDGSSPVSMVLANQFLLEPKDIVYIDGSGLVRFSRVLNLLLPGIDAGLTAAILTK